MDIKTNNCLCCAAGNETNCKCFTTSGCCKCCGGCDCEKNRICKKFRLNQCSCCNSCNCCGKKICECCKPNNLCNCDSCKCCSNIKIEEKKEKICEQC
ncbi:Hypothetical protein SRAE_2000428600 [Strongyloides ratti]|uniref:Uncharacterized protein n=1 Tax=Strongyloides ratti TaxID=34506 RepID=A0A090LN89_STRRB|nr:Hypothetical protein SRAE_2000428600 [Strongyloides ratti]CEF69639.1 Hypothetical protein SRAE_2000428600 [Strongyloides ratti]